MASTNLGDLQQLTMVSLLRLGDEAYGSRIREELRSVAGRNLSISAIYVTATGLRALEASREAANRMWSGLDGHLTKEGAP